MHSYREDLVPNYAELPEPWDPVSRPSARVRAVLAEGRARDGRRSAVVLAVAGLLMLLLAALASGCCAHRAAARAIAQDLPIYREGAAPCSTLTPAEAAGWEELGRRLEENARLLEEATR